MKKQLLALSIAALAAFGATNGAAAATLSIPVTISGNVTEACTTSTAGLDFSFADVVARGPVVEKSASVSVNCSSGATYKFSTDASGAAKGDYSASVGATAGAAKVSLAVNESVTSPDTPRTCTPADLPKTTGCTTPGTAGTAKKSLATMTSRSGTGSAEVISIFATLSDATDTAKAPSASGAVTVADSNFYVVY